MADSTRKGFLTVAKKDEYPTRTMRRFVSGVTGLPIGLVREAWESNPEPTPSLGTNWCAVALESVSREGLPLSVKKREEDIGATVWVALSFRLTFYGVDAMENAERFTLGAPLGQNLAELKGLGYKLRKIDSEVTRRPDLYSGRQWVDAYEVRITLAQAVTRAVNVRQIKTVGVSLTTEKGVYK